MSGVVIAISTFPDRGTASRVAEQLVSERLAACANISADVQSIYWWQGKLEQAGETLVFFKTTQARFAQLRERLHLLHRTTFRKLSVPLSRMGCLHISRGSGKAAKIRLLSRLGCWSLEPRDISRLRGFVRWGHRAELAVTNLTAGVSDRRAGA